MSDTLDPLSEDEHAERSRTESVLVVLYHVDLSMVGHTYALEGGPLTLGRDHPFFRSPSGASPLADPCLSRAQARITPLGDRGFEVTPLPGARRPTRAQTLEGVELPLPGVVAPNSLLLVGDRLLLGLLRRPAPRLVNSLGLVGETAPVIALRHRIQELAGGEETALLQGETGAGKELVARATHDASARRQGPFVAVNCAALPEALVESELFGHVKGAFSGAVGSRGLFGAAAGGTLLLDEVGELSLATQAKLLRALDTRQVRSVGATQEHAIDVRLLAATHRSLQELSKQGTFRFDLLSRLEGVQVEVPPLRERRADIPLLFAHFLRERLGLDLATSPPSRTLLASLTRPATQASSPLSLSLVLSLLQHRWPGNVRELSRLTQSLTVSARSSGTLPSSLSLSAPVPERERPSAEELSALLDRHAHVQSRAAASLDVPPATFDRWMRELGLARPRDLSAEQLRRAHDDHGGDPRAMATALRVSLRGLQLRLRELKLR